MNSTCSQKRLSESLSIIERLVGRKESLPVLSCILFEIKKDTCVLRATNLETGVEVTIPTKTKQEGKAALPARIFSQTIKTISDEEITLSKENENVRIVSKHTNTIIKTTPIDEFPIIPKNTSTKDKKQTTRIHPYVFTEGVQAVSYAVSKSMIRPELASIYLYTEDSTLIFAATDSFRLAEKKIKTKTKIDVPDILIPAKNASDLIHVLSHIEDEEVIFISDESQLSVEGGRIYFVSRVIDGTFPNYREIIPKKYTTEVVALTADLQAAFSKARVFSNTSQQVGLHVYPKRKTFAITAQNADIGETDDSIEAALTGEDIDINFNLSYLAECIHALQTDSVTLKFSGAGKPLVVRGVGDESFTYLVMPLNR